MGGNPTTLQIWVIFSPIVGKPGRILQIVAGLLLCCPLSVKLICGTGYIIAEREISDQLIKILIVPCYCR